MCLLPPTSVRNYSAVALVLATLSAGYFASVAVAQNVDPFSAGFQNRSNLTFSPDGKNAYWVEWNGSWGEAATTRRQIFTAERTGDGWSQPRPMSFTGTYSDGDPFVSPDGAWLYFVSDRPTAPTGKPADANIWRLNLSGPPLPEFVNVNSPATEYSPVVTASGNLYFASDRAGGFGRGDLYRADASMDGFTAPLLLGPAVNSPTGEWNLWVSPDEREMIFEASSRLENVSIPGDLYVAWRSQSGWTAAMPVFQLNTDSSDLLPRLTSGADRIFYTSAAMGGNAQIQSADWSLIRDELQQSYAPPLMVANRSSHEVIYLDLLRGQISDRIPTGQGPHLLSNVSNNRLIATGFGEYPQPHTEPVTERPPFEEALNSRVTLIDVGERSVALDVTIPQCARPHASWIVGQRGFITCQDERQIAIIDIADGSIIRRLPTLQDGSHVLSFAPNENILAVSNTSSNSVSLINIESGSTKVVPLAAGSEGAVAIDGNFWIANAQHGSVAVVGAESGAVLELTERVCGFPIALSKSSAGQVWVACFASRELLAFDADTYALQRRIQLDDQPLNLLTHPRRALAYVSLPRANSIAEIELTTGQEIRRIKVGIEPDGLRWADSGQNDTPRETP